MFCHFFWLLSSLCFPSAIPLTQSIRPPNNVLTSHNLIKTVGSLLSAVEDWTIVISIAEFPKDFESIRSCRIQAFADDAGTEPDTRRLLRNQMKFLNAEDAMTGRSTCLVAKERWPRCRVLGTADIQTRKSGTILLQNVFVAPDARGKGLARRLVKEAERVAAKSSDTIVLSVDTNNRPAVNLYDSCAYEASGVHALIRGASWITGASLQMDMKKHLP
jgi:ribosomal protein S18 acetylase RimI-like enzyme